MSHPAQLEPIFRKPYILGGRATVTVVNPESGNRYTYRVTSKDVGSADEPRTLYFVSVLTGPENERDYQFLGTIFDSEKFVHGRKSRIGADAPSARAFTWVWEHLDDDRFEIWHEGKCSRCSRTLTDPESIERGLGPKCAEKAAA